MSTASPNRNRRGLVWAVVGGAVLLVGIVAIVITSLMSQGPTPNPTVTSDPSNTATTEPTDPTTQQFVDPTAAERGWTPEPITTDPDTYVRAALAAASTFDTTLSSRTDWLAYLDTWFTPDTRYTSEEDRASDMLASQVELRQGVVLPEQEWDSLANELGRVEAEVTGDITYDPVPDDDTGDMQIATADVVLTFTRSDGADGETSYEDTVRVSVQILCGEGSIPTAGTDQQAGDCKVVRYFSGSVEP